ncbi:MAG: tRNA epoxyqueuosine(34) reductase QueG [Gammaproteobacteria bacterium]|nr:tRNA epoxyqueuosine(34) reductase QueG [Gammaproteobacteria bacterium]
MTTGSQKPDNQQLTEHAETSESISSERPFLLAEKIKNWAKDLGFNHTAISDIDLSECEVRFQEWLNDGFHGEMGYMSRHGTKRTRPSELVEGTVRVVSVRMDYLNQTMREAGQTLNDATKAYVSRYALGRDYHKVIRNRLQHLAKKISEEYGEHGYRAFSDSAPVMEKALAEKSGHGWIGKHTNLINQHQGSWFFLGELYTNIPLPIDKATSAHCGTCQSCIDVCPTGAIVEPYRVDARRCISYLTIELAGSIPIEFRKQLGNRIYGCDDCQLVCPWNRYAELSVEPDFKTRHGLDSSDLLTLFNWDEVTFLRRTEGSAIRRIGHHRWLRNIAVALGNAPYSKEIVESLTDKLQHGSDLVKEHVTWAIEQQEIRASTISTDRSKSQTLDHGNGIPTAQIPINPQQKRTHRSE